MALAGLFGAWRAEQGRAVRARQYVAAVMVEPANEHVLALAEHGDGDLDHARWELRYARRAIGLIVAERDALDDQTASDVAAALAQSQRADANIAAERMATAERQLNDRLAAYRAALADRTAEWGSAERLGRVLLTFARARDASEPAVRLAAATAGSMLTECNAALREIYGEVQLPENVKPSEI